jgi:hypothetical protein
MTHDIQTGVKLAEGARHEGALERAARICSDWEMHRRVHAYFNAWNVQGPLLPLEPAPWLSEVRHEAESKGIVGNAPIKVPPSKKPRPDMTTCPRCGTVQVDDPERGALCAGSCAVEPWINEDPDHYIRE